MVSDPLTGFAPDQLPDAVQLAASVEDQLRLIVLPRLTLVGLAVSVTVGGGATGSALTVMVSVSLLLPPAPLQVML